MGWELKSANFSLPLVKPFITNSVKASGKSLMIDTCPLIFLTQIQVIICEWLGGTGFKHCKMTLKTMLVTHNTWKCLEDIKMSR